MTRMNFVRVLLLLLSLAAGSRALHLMQNGLNDAGYVRVDVMQETNFTAPLLYYDIERVTWCAGAAVRPIRTGAGEDCTNKDGYASRLLYSRGRGKIGTHVDVAPKSVFLKRDQMDVGLSDDDEAVYVQVDMSVRSADGQDRGRVSRVLRLYPPPPKDDRMPISSSTLSGNNPGFVIFGVVAAVACFAVVAAVLLRVRRRKTVPLASYDFETGVHRSVRADERAKNVEAARRIGFYKRQ